MIESPVWPARTVKLVVIASWVALVLAIFSTATTQSAMLTVAAATLGSLFVLVVVVVPRDILLRGGIQFEITVIFGALLTIAAVTLTGGIDSPFVLLALMPTLLASVVGSTRIGLTTGLLSGALLAGVTVAQTEASSLAGAVGTIALFPLMALVVAQIRNILVEIEQRAASLERASLRSEAELARLGQANELLRRLTDVYGDGRTNPIDVSRAAMEAIVDAHPGSFATATMFDAQGPVVVARIGTDSPDLIRSQIPLGDGETTSGVVSLGTPRSLSNAERRDIDRLLRPVAVSFANTVLLQDIARTAVKEERLRLARELHDEVGPALAALGLSLDAVQISTGDNDLSNSLSHIREGLGGVVDDLRMIIADLREEASNSLSSELKTALRDLAPPPDINLELSERRPPRAGAMRQILAIVVESVRNSYRHADADVIQVKGEVERSRVAIEVIDNGTGFDPSRLPEGHFGVLGMRERADRIGAAVHIESNSNGTKVTLSWKEQR